MDYIFIINPHAGAGKAATLVENQLAAINFGEFDSNIKCETYETTGRGDATEYVKAVCRQRPADEICFIACGGDGTLQEVSSGLVGEDNKYLAVFSCGSGNDFVKYYPEGNFSDIACLFRGTPQKIDILKVNDKYSINICNFGFDAYVCDNANRFKDKKLPRPYDFGVAAALFARRFNKIDVYADGEKISGKRMLLCTLGNCSYVGSKYKCSPNARNNDGLIDLCLFRTMSLASFLSLMGAYERGEHLTNPRCKKLLTYRQVRNVHVSSENDFLMCLDGEIFPGKEFDISILPGAVNFILPGA